MADNHQTGEQDSASSPISPLTRPSVTSEAPSSTKENRNAGIQPKQAPVSSVFAPYDEEYLQSQPATSESGQAKPRANDHLSAPPKFGLFGFGVAGRPDLIRSPSTHLVGIPSTPSNKPVRVSNSATDFPMSSQEGVFPAPKPAGFRPDSRRATLAYTLSTPSPNPTVTPPTDLSFLASVPKDPVSESNYSLLPQTPTPNPSATSVKALVPIPRVQHDTVPVGNLTRLDSQVPLIDGLSRPAHDPNVVSNIRPSLPGNQTKRPRREIIKVSPGYVISGPPPPPIYFPAPAEYNPNIPYVPTAASLVAGTEALTYRPTSPYLANAPRPSSERAQSTADGVQAPPSRRTDNIAATTDNEDTENDHKTKEKKKPDALPKTWISKWFDHPLPGPKPEWSYKMPKEEPRMSRVYRTNGNSEDRDGSERLVFVSQDDAPYTAMGTKWAEDPEAHARFIMRQQKEKAMTRQQAEAIYDRYRNSQQFLNNRNPRSVPNRHNSIIPDTVEAVLDQTGVAESTKIWSVDSFTTMIETIGNHFQRTYEQGLTLLGHLIKLLKGFWNACKSVLMWLSGLVYSAKWWLLAAVTVFLVVFGVMNDSLGMLGLHKYQIPSTHTPTVFSPESSTLTTTISVVLDTPVTRPGVASTDHVITPFVQRENVEKSEVRVPVDQPGTVTARSSSQPHSTGPSTWNRILIGQAMPGVPMLVASSLKNVWASVTSLNVSSPVSAFHPQVPSWMNPSPIGRFIHSAASQVFDWSCAFITFSMNNRTMSFFTDPRVVIALVCVAAILGLYYVFLNRLRAVGNSTLAIAASILNLVKRVRKSCTMAIVSLTTEVIWPFITRKYTEARAFISKMLQTIKLALSNVPGMSREFWTFIKNIPYIMVWTLSNPVASVKSLIGHSLAYVLGITCMWITFFVRCISMLISLLLSLFIWILESILFVGQNSWAWIKTQYTALKVKMSTWTEGLRGWSVACSGLSWFGWFVKWVALLVIWTAMVFALGLGWRDIYEGFEKVIIEVAPC